MNDLLDQFLATRRASARAEAQLAPAAWRVGIDPAKAVALVLRRDGPQPVGSLGRALSTQPPSMTELADALERGGLDCRQRHPTDRRQQRLTITPTGEAVAAAFVASLGDGVEVGVPS